MPLDYEVMDNLLLIIAKVYEFVYLSLLLDLLLKCNIINYLLLFWLHIIKEPSLTVDHLHGLDSPQSFLVVHHCPVLEIDA